MEIEKNYHRVILTVNDALDALFRGEQIDNWLVNDYNEVVKFQAAASNFDSNVNIEFPEKLTVTPEEFHKKNQESWLMPNSYLSLDLNSILMSRCDTDEQKIRVIEELNLFKQYDLEILLRFMIYLVDVFQENNIIWGIGRGSSVSSYILFLIGIHKVDSIRYQLDIKDFLRE